MQATNGDSWPASLAPFLWLSGGNLNNGGNAGPWYVNGNNGLSNTNWNIGARNSGKEEKHSRNSQNPATSPARGVQQDPAMRHRAQLNEAKLP